MDIKRLHEAIKELRAELDRVSLAIQRIELIAEFAVQEQQTADASPEPESPHVEPSDEED